MKVKLYENSTTTSFRSNRLLNQAVLGLFLSFSLLPISKADEWPRWLGPTGDSVWNESGLIKEIPDDGLKVKWRVPVELGYSGPAVANGKVYLMDYAKTSGDISNRAGWKDQLEGKERVLCFSAETGELLWKHEYDRPYNLSYSGGPRCTPTIVDGKVYALGAEGDLLCLDADNGNVIWSKSFADDYGAVTPHWGYSGHPLIDGDTLYCVVGGEGSLAVAFDKDTGEERWRALSATEPGYCPPTLVEYKGVRQLLIWEPENLNSLNPDSGALNWSMPLRPAFKLPSVSPRSRDGKLFASAVGNIGVMMQLNGEDPSVEVIWKGGQNDAVYPVNSTPVMTETMIFGCDVETSALIGVSVADGSRVWQTKVPTIGEDQKGRHGTAFLARVRDTDRFFIFSETGHLILANLTDSKYEELGRFKVLETTSSSMGRSLVWSHPAFAAKSLFARNDKELVRVDLAASSY